MSSKCVIFGGTGFIGSHFAEYLILNGLVDEVYLADIRPIRPFFSFDQNKIHYVELDVRKPIDAQALPSDVTLVANFAAVHREPGHEDFEYYETNLHGAENVCAWAEKVGCKQIVFTSSIAPYGPSELTKDESSVPVPVSAYGGSKLAAEKIHLCWQNGDSENRRLVIVRPGVVFGPGEGGNVSRLVKAVLHRYFIYMGNRDTRKAGVYVKELCNAIWWVLQRQGTTGERVILFNMTMNPGPSIQDYVETVCKVAGIERWVPSLPYFSLLATAYVIDAFAKPLGITHPFSTVRIKKLVNSNIIYPGYLVNNSYPYLYTLETAFADWKQSYPEEWS
ncbi:NAD(P)-dependent oxidoreductase [Methylomonas paludis]|uniref:NAD(P)-dependent oxidoreductase n=1 Tax=Methylomonas paludis TaxID=1173101 RepID=A0A975RAW4_9GAMM|nr:NAD(P)-dependent oxidoreductase [Methylomonas paludis]QWF71661.1 NAD(P)-dependent oxidoreductase [Methylomonas paludis]